MRGKISILIVALLLMHGYAYGEENKKYMREWWDIDAFLNADKNYSITASIEYEKETPAANLFLTIFSLDENKFYDLGTFEENIDKILVENGYVRFENCWIKTFNPYEAYFSKGKIEIYLKMERISPLKKVAGEIADDIPFGLGYYNYTFTSKCMVDGWIKINGSKENFSGIGYYEHVYGNWSYNKPLKFFSSNIIKDYISLFRWWENNMSIDWKNLTLWTNNPFGYDWSWGFFENGWTIFFGNIPFWIKNIPLGIIYIYDGKKYDEFKLMGYEYMKGKYYNGSFFPEKFKIFAVDKCGNSLTLVFEMTHLPHIYEDDLSSPYWKKLILYESPGRIYGYINGERNIYLSGKGEIEIERQNNIFDYAVMTISLNTGINVLFLSYLLGFGFSMELSLFPFYFHFSLFHVGEDKTYRNSY